MGISSILRRLLSLLGVMPMHFGEEDGASAVEDDPTTDEEAADDTQDEGETLDASDEAADDTVEVVVSIGDPAEADPQQEEQTRAPDWVRDLRKANREKDKRIRELEARISHPAANEPEALGAKPTLAGMEYDEDRFAQALDAWHERKRAIDARAAQNERKQQEAQAAWQSKLDAYGRAKAALKVRDFEDAEGIAQDTFSATQQGVIVNGADNPALVVYALGSNPKKAKELAAIADPVKFAFAVAKLETQLKLTPKKSVPPPERVVRGSSGIVAGGTDARLAQLQAKADKTGDRTEVAAYMRAKKATAR
jgi:hypothetical protein